MFPVWYLSHLICDSETKVLTSLRVLCPALCVSVVKKVAQYMADVLEDSRDKVQENLLANGGNRRRSPQSLARKKKVNIYGWAVQMQINTRQWFVVPSAVDLVTYITRFQWDMAKYPIKQSLKNISEIISKVCRPWENTSSLFFLT